VTENGQQSPESVAGGGWKRAGQAVVQAMEDGLQKGRSWGKSLIWEGFFRMEGRPRSSVG
jgi:hypothetical protein